MKRVPVNQKQGALWTDAMASITQHSIGQMQGRCNNTHNQMVTGTKSHKTKSSDPKPTKTSQTMGVTLIMKIKGSKRVQTTTNRMETWTDKMDLTAALHTGATATKMVFTLSWWTCRTTTITDSRVTINALWISSRQLLRNNTTLAATNRKLLGSDRRYSCRQYQ